MASRSSGLYGPLSIAQLFLYDTEEGKHYYTGLPGVVEGYGYPAHRTRATADDGLCGAIGSPSAQDRPNDPEIVCGW